MNKENLSPPQKETVTKIHEYINQSVKTLSGGLVNPLIDYILPSFHQKRFEKWCIAVKNALIELEENKLTKKSILDDLEFITLLKESMLVASKTHHQEKHDLLKNILVNHFMLEIEFDNKLLFTKTVDYMTLSHFYLLNLIQKYFIEIKELDEFENIKNVFKKDSLYLKIPHNSYRMLLNDLVKWNLISLGDVEFKEDVRKAGLMSYGGEDKSLPYICLTDFGRDFLDYLTCS